MSIKIVPYVGILIVLISAVYAGLDVYIKEYKDESYYGRIVVANSGPETYHEIEIKMDDKEWNYLVGRLLPERGATWSGTITPGAHNFEIRTKEGYTYKETINILRSAKSIDRAMPASRVKDELEEAEKFREIREKIAEKRTEQAYGGEVIEEAEERRIDNKILVSVAIFIAIIIVIEIIRYLVKRKNE